jgi:Mrp family chromosome partitioning ATPase
MTLEKKNRSDPCATETPSRAPVSGPRSTSGAEGAWAASPLDTRSFLSSMAPGAAVSRSARIGNYSIVAANRAGWTRGDGHWDAEPVEVPRYLASLRRSWGLIVVIVASMTTVVYFISTALPKTYEATARIVMDDRPGGSEPADVETVRRRLATVRALLTTREVRVRAARTLESESAETLEDKVRATVDTDANIVDVHATDNDAAGAAAIGNTLARSFLAMHRAAERQRLARARAELLQSLERAPSPRSAEANAIRQRLSELSVSAAAAGTDLSLAEAAQPPTKASSPRPIRNTIFAFFASVFLGVLAALGLAQLAPRVAGGRELSALAGVPILAALPRSRRRSALDEAYQELQTAVSLELSSDAKIVVVAGALPGDQSSAVAAGLACSFAQSGLRTVLVSADLRRPRVHDVLGLPRSPGLVELLEAAAREESVPSVDDIRESSVHAFPVDGEELDVLTAGVPARNAARLLGGDALGDLLLELECGDYRHVVVEGPALLGSAHGQLVARYAHAVLAVCDVERLTPTDAVELGELLQRLDRPVAGLVVLGLHGAPTVQAAITQPRRARSRADA